MREHLFGTIISDEIVRRMESAADPDSEGRKIAVGVQPAFIDAMEKQMIPLGRGGTPEEAANGVYLFCTPESNYISGQVIAVSGGASL